MREYHETDILKKCCRICGKTSPQEKINRLRPDESNWFGLRLTRDDKICWICRSLYSAHKGNEFDEGKLLTYKQLFLLVHLRSIFKKYF